MGSGCGWRLGVSSCCGVRVCVERVGGVCCLLAVVVLFEEFEGDDGGPGEV